MVDEPLKPFRNAHSLRLPAWGPYTKRYAGISHVPDERLGLRFDLSVFPGIYRRRADLPNVTRESGFHPWEATPDLAYYSYRHELEWKDRLYADIAYVAVAPDARLIAATLVNNTELPQQPVLHFMASLHFPPLRPYSQEWLIPVEPTLPGGAQWIDALAYDKMHYATARPADHLSYEGWYRGEIRGHGFVDGRGLGIRFGSEAGDTVSYEITLEHTMPDAMLLFRYRADAAAPAAFRCSGLIDEQLDFCGAGDLSTAAYQFSGSGEFSQLCVPVGDLAAGVHRLTLKSIGAASIELDGFALVERSAADVVTFTEVTWNPTPKITHGPTATSFMLEYEQAPAAYGLAWGYPLSEVREFIGEALDTVLPGSVHNHTAKCFTGAGEGHYTNAFCRPIPLAPGETRTIFALVCTGTPAQVYEQLAAFDPDSPQLPELVAAARATLEKQAVLPDGDAFVPSQRRMAATTLTNVVYPVYTRGSYIKHGTPGRIWDCLYTWDSGFIGLGLAELDPRRAEDNLNAYLTEPGDAHAAFMHHGSPVPVQASLFHTLWNKTGDRALLEHAYPRLRQYHAFLCGAQGATTRTLKSDLLRTWDYFYNSGGWDDYPPQEYVHEEKLEASVAPMVNTAQSIRFAKILRMAALALGATEDVAQYDAEIATFTAAVQLAWDEPSGYFGYLRHDAAGHPTEILRHRSGANYNMGLDGVAPLVAGVCTPAQEARLLAHLGDPAQLLSPVGLSTVDQSAPYYRVDGYWNGAVWMPHQWFIWKALLDLGETALARRIAVTGVTTWQREVDASYNCCEHFIISTGRGAGWHQFGGLSTPVLAWFAAYYRPGHLTTGYDMWVEQQQFNADTTELTARLTLHGTPAHHPAILVTLAPGPHYRASWNGTPIDITEPWPGLLELHLPSGGGNGELWVGR